MRTPDKTDSPTARDRLFSIIRQLEIGMLSTIRPDGSIHIRPMVTRFGEDEQLLWFFTAGGSPKADEVDFDRHVGIAYADPQHRLFASVNGTARLTRDRERMKALWSPLLMAWFPKGLEDPDLALLRVEVKQGEYWDSPSSTMVEIIAAVQTGLDNPPPVDVGDHAKVRIKPKR